jgi:hypothetical protein
MKLKRKHLIVLSLFVFVLMGFVASRPPASNFKNLKVLPKDISKQHLDELMEEFSHSLGVKCDFCHAKQKDNPQYIDAASDVKPEKTVARKMITMSNKINKKYFHGKAKYGQEGVMLELRCVTCHHGEPHPEADEIMKSLRKNSN